MPGGHRESQVEILIIFGTSVQVLFSPGDYGCLGKLPVVRDFAIGNFSPVLGLGVARDYRKGQGHILAGLCVSRGESGIFLGAERLRQAFNSLPRG
jgi:hypothetical protein